MNEASLKIKKDLHKHNVLFVTRLLGQLLPVVLITLHCIFCLSERSDGGDCHLGTAHSNTTQGKCLSSSLRWSLLNLVLVPVYLISSLPMYAIFASIPLPCVFLPSHFQDHIM